MNLFTPKKLLALLMLVSATAISSQEIEEVVVSGSFIPDEKRDTSEINVILDASEIERTGDDNIAIALTRLTGLSLVRGKYVYVRGLGERYSSATLNGLALPSPEPLKRVVPLDLFPTEAIESSVVQKTYSPELAGEFGGGAIAIRTKAVPLERVLSFSFSTGYNDVTSLSNGLLYDGGEDDDFGYDDGIRNYPNLIGQAVASGTKVDRSNFSPIELANMGREFENSKLLVLQEGDVPVDNSFNFTYGDEIPFNFGNPDLSMGLFLTTGVRSSWDTQKGKRQSGSLQANGDGTSSIVLAEDKTLYSTSNDVTTYAMGVLGFETTRSELQLTNLYIHKGTKEARILEGFDPSDATDVREDYLEFFDRTMITSQLTFSTIFDNELTLDLKLAESTAARDAPYERSVFYEDGDEDGVYLYDVNTGRNQTQFSSVDDDISQIGLDISFPVVTDNLDLLLKAGFDTTENNRDAEVRSFRFLAAGGPLPQELLSKRIDYIFADVNFDPNRLLVLENTGSSSPAGYLGDLETDSMYLQVESILSDEYKIAFGARREDGKQTINTFDLFSANDGSIEKLIDEDYVLPSLSLTYLPAEFENLQFRFAYSETIARPTFRELSPTLFVDVDTDRVIAGSLYLENSEIKNFDFRAEYYFDQGQFLTAGLFAKEIMKPIEETVFESGDLVITSYQNVPKAELQGFELEFERYFEGLNFESEWASTKEFLVKVNYTFTDSELVIGTNDTFINLVGAEVSAQSLLGDGRDPRLQGQSDNIFNLQLGFNDNRVNSQGTLIVNYVSDRVRARGREVLPDIIEEVPTTIDFVYSRNFDYDSGSLKLSVEIRNLLDESYEATVASDIFYDQYDLGRSISLGVKYNLN